MPFAGDEEIEDDEEDEEAEDDASSAGLLLFGFAGDVIGDFEDDSPDIKFSFKMRNQIKYKQKGSNTHCNRCCSYFRV